MESLLRILFLPARHRSRHSRIPTGRASGPFAELQDPYVQLQRSVMSLRDHDYRGRPTSYPHIPPHGNHR